MEPSYGAYQPVEIVSAKMEPSFYLGIGGIVTQMEPSASASQMRSVSADGAELLAKAASGVIQ